MGDANDSPQAPAIQNILDAGFVNTFNAPGPLVTYHDFGRFEHAAHIDYIFARSAVHQVKETFLDDRKSDFYSDHYYLSTTFQSS